MQSRGNNDSDHRRHDRLLVTRFAGGDAYPSEKAEAEALVSSCSQCASLAADIQLLVSRTQTLPDARRTRDFRITPEQAERMRGSWLERLMRTLSAPGWSVVRPVAGAAFALGLALAVVGTLPVASPLAGRPAADAPATTVPQLAAPNPTDQQSARETARAENLPPEAAPGDQSPAENPAPGGVSSGEGTVRTDNLSSPEPGNDGFSEVYLQPTEEFDLTTTSDGTNVAPEQAATPARELLVIAGLALAVLALGALLIVSLARRRYADPLLR